jgi:hypothetical protein
MANEIVWAADTAAVAPLDTDDISLALLPGATGFDWKEIDSTRAAGFDPTQQIVVPGKAGGINVPLTAGAWHRRLPGDQPQLRDFGVKGDGAVSSKDEDGGAAMTSGQTTLTLPSGPFVASDVGKVVTVAGAAAGGNTLISTIAAFTSSTTVELAHAAAMTVSETTVYWGTDDTSAINAAIEFMAYYPLRSRALRVPRGIYMITMLEVPHAVLGLSLNGVSYWDSSFICFADDPNPAIYNKSQEFKMFDMTLMSALSSAENRASGKHGLRNDKVYDAITRPVADVDCVISRCRISGFSRGVYHKGRSLVMRGFNHIATCDWGIEFQWPDETDYTPGSGVMKDNLGFRGNIIEGLRCHSMNSGAVLNDGPNAHKIRGLKLDNIILDIGRCIFKGHLGIGGMLTNSASVMTPTTAVILTGGSNFTVANINVIGIADGITDYTPPNLIRLEPGAYPGTKTGEYRAGTLSNVQLCLSEQTAVIVAANTKLIGVKFDDFTFDDPGFTGPASYSAFQFNSTSSTIEINRPLLVATDSRRSFVHNTQASNAIHLNNASRAGGNATPLASGTTSSIIIDDHYQYTPSLTHTTNVAASTASLCDYVYLAGDLIQVSGRFTAQATIAGNCIMQIALPVPSNFAGPGQASGSFIAGTTGSNISNIAGVVDSNGTTNAFEVSWAAPDTTSRWFTFLATYRVI